MKHFKTLMLMLGMVWSLSCGSIYSCTPIKIFTPIRYFMLPMVDVRKRKKAPSHDSMA